MRFKMVQFAILLTFVMSVVYMAQVPNGFGGEPSTHIPGQWINSDGDIETPPNIPSDEPARSEYLTSLIGTDRDPRGKSFGKIVCGANGEEYVYARAWYYEGGKIDNAKGHRENPNHDTHRTTYKQAIYKIVLSGSASTSATSASGRLDPEMENPEALAIESSEDPLSFQGQGKITLDIPEITYHHRSRFKSECEERTSGEYYWKPKAESTLKIVVHRENVTETRKGSISVGATSGEAKNASANFAYTWTWGRGWSVWNINGRGFGIEASVGGWWTAYGNNVIHLQGKTAAVYGNVSSATLPSINAAYTQKNSLCPPNSSQAPQQNIPHTWDASEYIY